MAITSHSPINTKTMHLLPQELMDPRVINGAREIIQKEIDAEFNDAEQSTLFQCLDDKTAPELHVRLNSLVRRKLTMDVPVELYRGVSQTTLNMLQKLDVGDSFVTNRVTSFSTDYAIARDFSGSAIYGTHAIFSLRNCPIAFNYKEVILRMLIAMPDSEFSDSVQRGTQIAMVEREEEWMLPSGTKFQIEEIEDRTTDPLSRPKVIYHLRFISI